MKIFWDGFWLGFGISILGFIGLDGYEDRKEKICFTIGVFSGICFMIGICLATILPIALKN